jgi:pyrimidine operon attenuation protein/uracil phosphoribosyltransferase
VYTALTRWPTLREGVRGTRVSNGRPSAAGLPAPAAIGYAGAVEAGKNTRQILSAEDMRRAIVRLSHEIVEKNGGAEGLALVGIEHRGPALAARIAGNIAEYEGVHVPVVALDVGPFRDDRPGAIDPDAAAVIPHPHARTFDPAVTTVVLVDDVLFTGRTARAGLDALVALGRPAAVRLAVLVDRGHRELPIRADFVGKNVPTAREEHVEIRLTEAGSEADEVLLVG